MIKLKEILLIRVSNYVHEYLHLTCSNFVFSLQETNR